MTLARLVLCCATLAGARAFALDVPLAVGQGHDQVVIELARALGPRRSHYDDLTRQLIPFDLYEDIRFVLPHDASASEVNELRRVIEDLRAGRGASANQLAKVNFARHHVEVITAEPPPPAASDRPSVAHQAYVSRPGRTGPGEVDPDVFRDLSADERKRLFDRVIERMRALQGDADRSLAPFGSCDALMDDDAG